MALGFCLTCVLLFGACESREAKLERLQAEAVSAQADLDRWRAAAVAAFRYDMDSTDVLTVSRATDSAKATMMRLEHIQQQIDGVRK